MICMYIKPRFFYCYFCCYLTTASSQQQWRSWIVHLALSLLLHLSRFRLRQWVFTFANSELHLQVQWPLPLLLLAPTLGAIRTFYSCCFFLYDVVVALRFSLAASLYFPFFLLPLGPSFVCLLVCLFVFRLRFALQFVVLCLRCCISFRIVSFYFTYPLPRSFLSSSFSFNIFSLTHRSCHFVIILIARLFAIIQGFLLTSENDRRYYIPRIMEPGSLIILFLYWLVTDYLKKQKTILMW